MKIILKDRFYVPLEAIDRAALKKFGEVNLQTKSLCRSNCPFANKHGRFCSTCPGKDSKLKMWKLIELKGGRRIIALPAGDDALLKKVVKGRIKIIDRRTNPSMRSNLCWTGKLRRGGYDSKGRREADQRGMLMKWKKHTDTGSTGGIIISPPRSGKCLVAGTLIKTNVGYQRIEELFDGVEIEDSIGNFGNIYVNNSITKIQGLHKRVADEIVTIELENGIQLGGTPEHPIAVVSGNSRLRDGPSLFGMRWINLNQIQMGEGIYFPPIAKNNSVRARVSEAMLIGHCVATTDLTGLKDGRIIIDGISDYAESEEFAEVLMAITGLELVDGLEFNLNMYVEGYDWVKRILNAADIGWRTFIEAALSSNFSPTPSIMLPDVLAQAMAYHLLGNGVECSLHKEPFGLVVVIHDVEGLSIYVKGERPVGTEMGLFSSVVRITKENKQTPVFDLMTSEHAFNSNGILSHNTVIGAAATLATRSRTFITGSQSRFIKQFGRTFGQQTNLREIAGPRNQPVVIIDPKGWSEDRKHGVLVLKKWGPEVDRADVIMCAYQQLITKQGQARIRRYLQNKIGTVIVDETHQAAAPCLSRIVNRLNARRRLGLTATLKRKDGMEPLVEAVLGRTVAVGKIASTLPSLRIFETGISSKRTYKLWSAMETFLTKNEQRNRLIVRQVFKDLRENKKHFILLPVTRIQHNIDLVRMINTQADFCRKHQGEDWPTDLAVSYRGGGDLDKIINGVDAGRYRVVVATYSMVKFGIDVQRWTHVYIGITPTSNAANVYQALNRCCTPYSPELENKIGEKPLPIVRFVIDDMPASVFCFAKLWNNTDYGLRGALSGENYFGVKLARIGPETLQRMEEIARFPKSYSFKDSVKKQKLNVRKGSIWNP